MHTYTSAYSGFNNIIGGNQTFFLGSSLSFKCVSRKFQIMKIIPLPLKLFAMQVC